MTSRDELKDKLTILRAHGSSPKYFHKIIGGNFRLDALQASVLSVKLRHLDLWSEKRQENADLYDMLLCRGRASGRDAVYRRRMPAYIQSIRNPGEGQG